ncbi:hypothetical protein LDK02_08210 [Fusobacterium animalis]|uniref:hypothetical protein n=1 Tax=Fusobacterium animalis TaxID=76859 RepID=UPI0030D4C773
MSKIIRFKNNFFEQVFGASGIERNYLGLSFNYSDLNSEEQKEVIEVFEYLFKKFKKIDMTKTELDDYENKIYYNVLSTIAVKHIFNKLILNSAYLSEDKSYIIWKYFNKNVTIKVHSSFISNKILFALYADSSYKKKSNHCKSYSAFNVIGEAINPNKNSAKIDVYFLILYNSYFLQEGSFNTFKNLYISQSKKEKFYILGFLSDKKIKSFSLSKWITNKVFFKSHELNQSIEEIMEVKYHVAPIDEIKDFIYFIKCFCKKYNVKNPYQNEEIVDYDYKTIYKYKLLKSGR